MGSPRLAISLQPLIRVVQWWEGYNRKSIACLLMLTVSQPRLERFPPLWMMCLLLLKPYLLRWAARPWQSTALVPKLIVFPTQLADFLRLWGKLSKENGWRWKNSVTCPAAWADLFRFWTLMVWPIMYAFANFFDFLHLSLKWIICLSLRTLSISGGNVGSAFGTYIPKTNDTTSISP